jgi:hypothetical protein
MSSCLDSYWEERLETVKALIVKYDAALLALGGGAQSYELDTGQTRVRKTQADLEQIRLTRAGLLNELATLDARVNGASTIVVPGF